MQSLKGRAAILHAYPMRFPGGGERFVDYLTKLFEEHNWKVNVLHPDNIRVLKLIRSHIPLLKEALVTYLMGAVAQKLCIQWDLVICQGHAGWNYHSTHTVNFNIYHMTSAGFAEAVRRLLRRSSYVKFRYLSRLLELWSGRDKHCIVGSCVTQRELQRFYGISPAVVPYGVDTDLFYPLSKKEVLRQRWNLPKETPIGLFVGRWDIITKGIDILLDIIQLRKDIFWVVNTASGGVPRELTIYQHVRLYRGLPDVLLRELYSLADFLLFPSRYETFGYVFWEALASGLPAIAWYEVGTIREAYNHPILGELAVEVLEVECFSQAIDKLLSSADLQKHISKVGREIVMCLFPLSKWKETMACALGL